MGDLCIKIQSKTGKYFTQKLYIQENLTLFMGLPSHFKQSNALIGKLCIWDPPIQENVCVYDRERYMNMQVFMCICMHVYYFTMCVYSHFYTLTQVTALYVKWFSMILM